jgi:multiple sugar transport system substrate-binding protein
MRTLWSRRRTIGSLCLITSLIAWAVAVAMRPDAEDAPAGRQRVVFWHFWGGAQRQAVTEIVRRFNSAQTRYWVEEIAVPGQNLDMKFFMALAGGDFPDVLNQDEQIIAQWAERGVLSPIRTLTADNAEYRQLQQWLSPAAREIGTYSGELFALCNAIDIRALFYRADALQGLPPPTTIEELDRIAQRNSSDPTRIAYLPDDRRLWAWGVVFGGDFYDEQTGKVTANDPRIVAALQWMTSYTHFHGLQQIRAFRSTNRETGAGSMLIDGRYGLMLDGQWRVAELDEHNRQALAAGGTPIDYGVAPLPTPPSGRDRAGWVNGNFFVVPRGCRNPQGAWEFMKFWSGFGGHEAEAAISAAAGGWVPASRYVVEQPAFDNYLRQHPQFRLFVDLAQSPNQVPTPTIPVQAYFFERVNHAVEEALSLAKSPQQALDEATRDVQQRLDAVRDSAK